MRPLRMSALHSSRFEGVVCGYVKGMRVVGATLRITHNAHH